MMPAVYMLVLPGFGWLRLGNNMSRKNKSRQFLARVVLAFILSTVAHLKLCQGKHKTFKAWKKVVGETYGFM